MTQPSDWMTRQAFRFFDWIEQKPAKRLKLVDNLGTYLTLGIPLMIVIVVLDGGFWATVSVGLAWVGGMIAMATRDLAKKMDKGFLEEPHRYPDYKSPFEEGP